MPGGAGGIPMIAKPVRKSHITRRSDADIPVQAEDRKKQMMEQNTKWLINTVGGERKTARTAFF